MPFFLILLLAALTAGQQETIKFINPSPMGAVRDFTLNPTFVLGSNINIQWTSTLQSVSLVLNQERPGDSFEYVFREFLPALPTR